MNSILRIYFPLLIFRICWFSLIFSHPSDCNIVTRCSHHKTVSFEHKISPGTLELHMYPPSNHIEAPPNVILLGHPLIQLFHCNIRIGEHCNHHILTPFGPWTYQIFVPFPCPFLLQALSSELYPPLQQGYFSSVLPDMGSLCQWRTSSCLWREN